MADIYEIPINSDDAAFKIRTSLEDTQFVLSFRWNGRMQRWIMDILNASEENLLVGLALNVDHEMIRRFEIDGLPAGGMILFDQGGTNTECGREDLGDRCKLLYQESV